LYPHERSSRVAAMQRMFVVALAAPASVVFLL
jgi:hypothetical protein